METKHTPGPWRFEPPDSGDPSVGIYAIPPMVVGNPDGQEVPVCVIEEPKWLDHTQRKTKEDWDECYVYEGDYMSNAHLIAAAPDMLEALETVCNAYPNMVTEIMDVVKDAIAKAKGETHAS